MASPIITKMKHLYPKAIKTGLLALAVAIITSQAAIAQCPAGSTSNTAGVYTNGQVVCISTSFSGNITINNGAKMVIVSGGNYTGQITANNGSTVEVRTGGTFNPGTANNFAAAVTSEKNSTVKLGTGGFGIASGFSMGNSGNMTWVSNWNQNSAVTVYNYACGTMTFTQNTTLQNSASIINNGTLNFQGELNTNSGTTINNRGRITVAANFNQAGLFYNQWQAIFKGGSNNFNNGDSVVNLYTMTFTGSGSGTIKMRNEGLIWFRGSFNYNGGTFKMNAANAQFRVDGAFSNNGTITGPSSIYVAGSLNNNGSLVGQSSSAKLTINQLVSNGTRTNLTYNTSLATVDTTSFTGGVGNPSTCASLLPVTITALKGVYNNEAIELTWASLSEINSKQFVIEYSTDGLAWVTAGVVAAQGNTSMRVEYSFRYTKIIAATNYFRLRMEDQDGSLTYSTTVLVKTSGTQTITASVYPNPFVEKLDITVIMHKTTAVNVKVYDMNGRIAKSQQFSAQSGSNKFTVAALNNLNSGLYVVEVTAGEEKWMQKIIK